MRKRGGASPSGKPPSPYVQLRIRHKTKDGSFVVSRLLVSWYLVVVVRKPPLATSENPNQTPRMNVRTFSYCPVGEQSQSYEHHHYSLKELLVKTLRDICTPYMSHPNLTLHKPAVLTSLLIRASFSIRKGRFSDGTLKC